MDAMTQRLDVNACASSPTCDRCGSFDHVTVHYQVENPFIPSLGEQVAYVNNFQPRSNHDPYFNTHNLDWKHHPNFSCRNELSPFFSGER